MRLHRYASLLTGAAGVSTLALFLPLHAAAQTSAGIEMRMATEGKKQTPFIEKFAQQAKDRDINAIVAELDPSTLKSAGEANIRQVLETKVLPFFANYTALSTYERITNATLPDGRAGLWHYTYIKSADNKQLPFRIAVLDTPDGPKVLDVVVNECVKGRHPICN